MDNRVARGSFQRGVMFDLLAGCDVPTDANRLVRGQARSYAGKYTTSISKVVQRLQEMGYSVEMVATGSRGGSRVWRLSEKSHA